MCYLSQWRETVSTDLLYLLETEQEAGATDLLPSWKSQSSWFKSYFHKALFPRYKHTC